MRSGANSRIVLELSYTIGHPAGAAENCLVCVGGEGGEKKKER